MNTYQLLFSWVQQIFCDMNWMELNSELRNWIGFAMLIYLIVSFCWQLKMKMSAMMNWIKANDLRCFQCDWAILKICSMRLAMICPDEAGYGDDDENWNKVMSMSLLVLVEVKMREILSFVFSTKWDTKQESGTTERSGIVNRPWLSPRTRHNQTNPGFDD